MAIYAISDLHLSLGTQKPMDVFEGWEGYVEKIEKNWKEKVKEEDTVVIAGDISWAMKLEESKNDFAFINSLPGKKILIKGNHDYWWSTKKKIEDFFKANKFDSISIIQNTAIKVGEHCICGTRGWMMNSETQEDVKILNREIGRLKTSLDIAKKENLEPILFLHYPPVYGGEECKDIIDILIARNIKKCYYGHVHGSRAMKKAVVGDYKGMDFKLISCDYIGFSPVVVTN